MDRSLTLIFLISVNMRPKMLTALTADKVLQRLLTESIIKLCEVPYDDHSQSRHLQATVLSRDRTPAPLLQPLV